MKPIRGAFLITLEVMEQIYSVPPEEREALLVKLAKEHKAKFLGVTDKTGPELAIDLIKSGIRAKSYVKGKPLTKSPKSDTLLQKTQPDCNKKPPA